MVQFFFLWSFPSIAVWKFPPPKIQLHLCLNGVWNSLLFMMCNNGSGRHKVCSYYVIKTICVFPKQEEARWEGGEEKKEQKKSQDWRYRACVGSRKLRLIQLSHKKTKKNALWIQSLWNVLYVHFPRYLPIYIGFQMLAFLRAVEIFAFEIKIVSFLEAIKPKKVIPTLTFKNSLLKPKRLLQPFTLGGIKSSF